MESALPMICILYEFHSRCLSKVGLRVFISEALIDNEQTGNDGTNAIGKELLN